MSVLKKFLGEERWRALYLALRSASTTKAIPELGAGALVLALLIALTPVAATFWADMRPKGSPSSPLPTVAFGVCAILAMLIRPRLGLPFVRTPNWRNALSLTHTAFALGCIPAVLVLIASKTLLADRHDTLAKAVSTSGGAGVAYGIWTKIGLVLAIAAWVAVTEELIFRGLLVSVVRRLRFIGTQGRRDAAAAVLSALIFGLAHYANWGLLPAIALIGLGLGFVAAYIANGEQLMPLVLYHFAFDTLSIAVSLGW